MKLPSGAGLIQVDAFLAAQAFNLAKHGAVVFSFNFRNLLLLKMFVNSDCNNILPLRII